MIEQTVSITDGTILRYAISDVTTNKPWIALVMPFGLRLSMVQPFFDFFSAHYRVIAWESRLILDDNEHIPETEAFSVANHVSDLFSVLDACGASDVTLIGYCSGAGIALAAITLIPERFRSLVLAHGEYTMLNEKGCTTRFAADIDSLLLMAADNEAHASAVYEKLQADRLENSNVPAGIDNPYSRLVYLRRYARNYLAYKAENYQALAQGVQHETLLLSGEKDIQTNILSSERILRLIKRARLEVDPDADHYGLIRHNSNTMTHIWNYLLLQRSDAYVSR